mgnify:CR=1 FL=1
MTRDFLRRKEAEYKALQAEIAELRLKANQKNHPHGR